MKTNTEKSTGDAIEQAVIQYIKPAAIPPTTTFHAFIPECFPAGLNNRDAKGLRT